MQGNKLNGDDYKLARNSTVTAYVREETVAPNSEMGGYIPVGLTEQQQYQQLQDDKDEEYKRDMFCCYQDQKQGVFYIGVIMILDEIFQIVKIFLLVRKSLRHSGFFFFVIIKGVLQLGMIIGIFMICKFWKKDNKRTRRLLPRACCLFTTNQFCRLILNCFEIGADTSSEDQVDRNNLANDAVDLVINIILVFVYMYFMGILNRYRLSKDKEVDDAIVSRQRLQVGHSDVYEYELPKSSTFGSEYTDGETGFQFGKGQKGKQNKRVAQATVQVQGVRKTTNLNGSGNRKSTQNQRMVTGNWGNLNPGPEALPTINGGLSDSD